MPLEDKNCPPDCPQNTFVVRVIERQDRGKNCPAAIFTPRQPDVSLGPLGFGVTHESQREIALRLGTFMTDSRLPTVGQRLMGSFYMGSLHICMTNLSCVILALSFPRFFPCHAGLPKLSNYPLRNYPLKVARNRRDGNNKRGKRGFVLQGWFFDVSRASDWFCTLTN